MHANILTETWRIEALKEDSHAFLPAFSCRRKRTLAQADKRATAPRWSNGVRSRKCGQARAGLRDLTGTVGTGNGPVAYSAL